MNWILLIIGGLFEVGFATCLGKAKETTGATAAWWIVGLFAWQSVCIYFTAQHLHYLLVLLMQCGRASERLEPFWSACLFLKNQQISGDYFL